MTIAKDFASKFAVAFVAVAMIFSMFASAVSAQESSEDLQKTINDLLAQVATLQAGMDKTTTTTSSSCVSVPAPLTMGSQGANVTALQNRLIADGQAIAAGATGYFGGQTKAALAAWQAANGVAPAAGYYGPITMAAMDAKCVPADEDEEDEDDTSSDELSGEGELSSFEIDDASDTDIQEGAEDAEIGMLTIEAEDGDIEVSRIDFNFAAGTTEDPWDVFETITLWVDGDMIAEFDASDEDEYLDEDNGEFRITGLDLVVLEDEEVDITVGATVMGSVDTLEDWDLDVDEIRYFDADGVATDEDGTVVTDETAMAFDIVEEGDGEELKFSLGDNNPEATDIIVDEDDTTDGVTIMEYTIEAEEGDIELNTLAVRVDTTASTSAVVDEIFLVIDGEEFDAENLVSTNKGTFSSSESRYVDNNTTDDAVWYVFDIDGDVVVDDGSEVTAEVVVDFKAQDPNGNTAGVAYANGTTIEAQVSSVERDVTDAEGADDLGSGDFTGTAIGEEHTVVAEGIVVPVDGFTATADTIGDNDNIGEYVLEFEVTAIEGDFYITDNVSTSSAVTDGIRYTIDPAASGAATAVVESTGDEDTAGVFTVQEGETETFTLTVTFDPTAAGSFRVQLEEVWYSANTNGTGSAVMYIPTPTQDFRTASKAINAN